MSTFKPHHLGKGTQEKLDEIIGDYDGLAIRSATKATATNQREGEKRGDGRAGNRRRQVEIRATNAKGRVGSS